MTLRSGVKVEDMRLLRWSLSMACLLLIAFGVILPGVLLATTDVNGDFSLDITLNGQDITLGKTTTVDPDEEMVIDIHVFDVAREVTLERLSIRVTFLGSAVATINPDLQVRTLLPGEEYRETFTLTPKDYLRFGNINLITGVYRAEANLEYEAGPQVRSWLQPLDLKVPGNPVTTPAGAVAMATGAGAVVGALGLARTIAAPGLAAGAVASGGVSLGPSELLLDLASDRMESTTRGRVVNLVTKESRRRVVRNLCQLCSTRFRSGRCPNCGRSAKEAREAYTELVQHRVMDAAPILARGRDVTLDALCSELGIDRQLGSDVLAVARSARLVKVRGLSRKVTGKVLMIGVNSGVSVVLWVTIGGFTRLTPTILIAILVGTLAVPLIVTRAVQWRARRAAPARP